jgi:hypothetical protein
VCDVCRGGWGPAPRGDGAPLACFARVGPDPAAAAVVGGGAAVVCSGHGTWSVAASVCECDSGWAGEACGGCDAWHGPAVGGAAMCTTWITPSNSTV